jgi:hypothetical protein
MLSKDLIGHIQESYPEIEGKRNLSKDVFIACDFREKKKNNEYWGISFLLSDLDSIEAFSQYRLQIKKEHNIEGQEISYKKLKPSKFHPTVLNKYLSAADTIDGILFNFMIHPSYDTVYNNSKSVWRNDKELSTFKFNQFQKLELFSHLSGLVISSINSEIETLKWITDNDNVLNNPSRKGVAIKYYFKTISQYLDQNDFEYNFIDPDRDSDDRILADLANIPDLIVGPMVDIKN